MAAHGSRPGPAAGPAPDWRIVCIPATRDTHILFGMHTAPHQGERGAGAAIAPGLRPGGGHKSGRQSGRRNPVEIRAAVERPSSVFGCLHDPRESGVSLLFFAVLESMNAYLLNNFCTLL